MRDVIEFSKFVIAPVGAVVLVIVLFTYGLSVSDRSNADWLLREKSFVITDIYPSTNQFTINGSFILHMNDRYKFTNEDYNNLEVRGIINRDLGNRVLISFNNSLGYIECEVFGYLPDKHIKPKAKGARK